MPKISIVDDGGPVTSRLAVNCSPGPHNGERFALVTIGDLEIRIESVEEAAAERCQAIAAELHAMALALLRSTLDQPDPPLMAIACDALGTRDEIKAAALRLRNDTREAELTPPLRQHGEEG